MATETVGDVMHKGVVSCLPSTSLRDAARLMTQAKVRALVVMDNQCGLSGIVSTTDLVTATLESAGAPESLTVKDVMTPSVLTIGPGESVELAAKLMLKKRVHRLVVVDEAGGDCNPIGVISMGDIVRSISEG